MHLIVVTYLGGRSEEHRLGAHHLEVAAFKAASASISNIEPGARLTSGTIGIQLEGASPGLEFWVAAGDSEEPERHHYDSQWTRDQFVVLEGLPTNGQPVHLFVVSYHGGREKWQQTGIYQIEVQAFTGTPARIEPFETGDLLAGNSVAIRLKGGTPGSEYWVAAGDRREAGRNHYDSKWTREDSVILEGLPEDGSSVHLFVVSYVGGRDPENRTGIHHVEVLAFSPNSIPGNTELEPGRIANLKAGEPLTGPEVLLEIEDGPDGAEYWVAAGDRPEPGRTHFDQKWTQSRIVALSGLPTDGSPIHLFVVTMLGGREQKHQVGVEHMEVKAVAALPGQVSNLSDGDLLLGGSVLVEIEGGTPGTEYWVAVGDRPEPGRRHYDSKWTADSVVLLEGLPLDGSPVHSFVVSHSGGRDRAHQTGIHQVELVAANRPQGECATLATSDEFAAGLIFGGIQNAYFPFSDLSKWEQVRFRRKEGNPLEEWRFEETNGLVAARTIENGSGSFLLSPDTFHEGVFVLKLGVDSAQDDDSMGFIWGYEDFRKFYYFTWHQGGEPNSTSHGAIQVFRVDVPSQSQVELLDFPEDWGPYRSRLYENRIPWKDSQFYDIRLVVSCGRANVLISESDSSHVVDSFELDIPDYSGGRFGFYSASQPQSLFSGGVSKCSSNPLENFDLNLSLSSSEGGGGTSSSTIVEANYSSILESQVDRIEFLLDGEILQTSLDRINPSVLFDGLSAGKHVVEVSVFGQCERKVASEVLSFEVVDGQSPSSPFVREPVTKVCSEFPESEGRAFGGVFFPGGAISFADVVVSYSPGSFVLPPHRDPTRALDAPDFTGEFASRTVSLGNRGELVLQFKDNVIVGGRDEGVDVWVFESGGGTENVDAYIGTDGREWISIGRVDSNVQGIDIDPYLKRLGLTMLEFSFVKLVDVGNDFFTGPYAGADINAVGAISSRPRSYCLSIKPTLVPENVGVGMVALRLEEPVPFDLEIEYTLEGVTATFLEDYVLPKKLKHVISAWETESQLPVQIVDDDICEPLEKLGIIVTRFAGAQVLENNTVVAIEDDDLCNKAPSISDIPDQVFVRGQSLPRLEFIVSDDRTAIEDLNVKAVVKTQSGEIENAQEGWLERESGEMWFSFPKAEAFLSSRRGTVAITVTDRDGLSSQTSFDYLFLAHPTVSIISPSGGAELEVGQVTEIIPSASDVDGDVVSVEFFVGGKLIISDTSPPFVTSWRPDLPGTAILSVTARDNDGLTAQSEEIRVVVVAANTVPTIGEISNQRVRVGEELVGIPIKVSDAESEPDDLVVVAESLDAARLPNESLTVRERSGDDQRLSIASLDRPTGSTPIGIRVTVTDEQGASASTEFSLTVLNDLPTIEIVAPSNYAIIQIPVGADVVDVPVGILINDDQPVEDVQLLLNSEVLEETVVGSSSVAGRFDANLSALSAGEYYLTASARDAATGELVLSSSVYIKVVAGGEGEIAIVHPEAETRDEIFTIWDYLVNLGRQPQVFLQDEVSVEALESYRAVIWHDLGLSDLQDRTVSSLSALQDTVRMPIYFIGERLASSVLDLSEKSQDEWSELTKLAPADERVMVLQVNFYPFFDSFQNQIDGFWALEDGFELEFEVDVTRAHEEAQVLAISGVSEIPVVLRYPATDAEAQVAARRFVQSFPVREKGNEAARRARRTLFDNALCYLLNGNQECQCPSAVIDLKVLTEGGNPTSASLGETFEIELELGNFNGRCDVQGGRLSFQLPAGLELSDVVSERNFAWRWEAEVRTAFIEVGILEDSPTATLATLQLRSLLPGDYGLEIIASGNYFDPLAVPVTVKAEGAFLAVDQDGSGGVALQVFGTTGSNVRVEWSDTLGAGARWQLLEKVQFLESETERVLEGGELELQRFYRVVGH